MTDPLVGIDAVPWDRLHHAYGSAHDVPDQLRALRSADPEVRRWGRSSLGGNVYHQGTRWEASSHVVPFLVALVDELSTPDRPGVVGLLRRVLVGDRDDGDLPFDVCRALPLAGTLTDDAVRDVLRWLYDDAAEPTADDHAAGEAAAQRWERDAYRAGVEPAGRYVAWLSDVDAEVAAAAAELIAWYPATPGAVRALVDVPCDEASGAVRASANLALAHLPGTDEVAGVDAALGDLLDAPHHQVRLTAAIALAYRRDKCLPDRALDVLVAEHPLNSSGDVVAPWRRPLVGFRALAINRVGLA